MDIGMVTMWTGVKLLAMSAFATASIPGIAFVAMALRWRAEVSFQPALCAPAAQLKVVTP
jgi:hypothetical protein